MTLIDTEVDDPRSPTVNEPPARSADRAIATIPANPAGRPRTEPIPGPITDPARPTPPLAWWRELVAIPVLYAAYSLIRNRFGSASVDPEVAYTNAQRIIGLERTLGMFHEAALQRWVLAWEPAVVAANVWYGTAHFTVTIALLVLLFRCHPDLYRYGRNALIATTALALVGFAWFPLMPPRLLCPGCSTDPTIGSVFVDTLATHAGSWSFASSSLQVVANQWAAMPSLHLAWALWCSVMLSRLAPRGGRRTARALKVGLMAYPTITLVVIVATGNHFWLDALGGVAVVAAGFLGARLMASAQHRWWRRGSGNHDHERGAAPRS